jgi:hypothetical protein
MRQMDLQHWHALAPACDAWHCHWHVLKVHGETYQQSACCTGAPFAAPAPRSSLHLLPLQHSHIVAIKTSGNVFSHEAVQQFNVKMKSWRDLITDEPFTRADILTIQARAPGSNCTPSASSENRFAH